MYFRNLSLAVVLLLASGCTEAFSPVPQSVKLPQAKTPIPDCRPSYAMDEEGFTLIVQTLRRNGEPQRANEFYGRVRSLIEARLTVSDAAAPGRMKPALDAVFSGPEIAKLAVCSFVRYDRAQPEIEAWEAWSLDEKMREIHGRIVDIPTVVPAGRKPVVGERRELLARVAGATDLANLLHVRRLVQQRAVALVEVALDPTSSVLQDLALNGPGFEVPDEREIVDGVLAPRLDGVSDDDLRRYLAFAESREGRAYYQTLGEAMTLSMGQWFVRLDAVLKAGAEPTEIAHDPKAAAPMLAEARRLFDEVGTRVVVDEARTLLLKAERLDPGNAEIQNLLGRVTLSTLPPGVPYEDGQLRPVIDKMHPAQPERYAQAEAYLRKAIELDPKHAEAQLYLGRIRFLLSQDEAAAKQYAIARRLDPKVPGLPIFEADMAYVGGRYAEAERIYRTLLAAPERRASGYHFALNRLYYALIKQGREREFRKIAQVQLRRKPDMWDFRLQHALRLLATDGTVEEVAALIEPVPETWLPDHKRDLQVRLQLLRAGQATATARRDAVRRAFGMAKTPMQVMDSTCVSRVRVDIVAEVILASGMQDRFADELLACAMWKRDLALIDAVMPLVKRIDGPNEAMQGDAPLCSAAVLMDAQIFERLLKAKADPAKRCGDGKTVRELLTERATRAYAEPDFNASNRALLKVLDRYDRGG
jgi:tetratricopeptide (TPR) repeat protein